MAHAHPSRAGSLRLSPTQLGSLERYPTQPRPPCGAARDDERAMVAVQDALSAALTGDEALCELRQTLTLYLCLGHPARARAAATEIEQALALDVIARHLGGCHKRRRLQRALIELAARLNLAAASQQPGSPALDS